VNLLVLRPPAGSSSSSVYPGEPSPPSRLPHGRPRREARERDGWPPGHWLERSRHLRPAGGRCAGRGSLV